MTKINAGGFAGRFKMTAIRPDGSKRIVADWFDNLITDSGLNRIGTGAVGEYCRVGSGSATPNVLDTTLQTTVASTNTQQASTQGQQSAEPYFGWYRRTYRFAIGAAAGNLSEVGVGWGVANLVFSRALIVDSFGDPTTVTVLSDEILDVTYEIRLYPPLTDQTVNVTIAGVDHTITIRAAAVTGSNWQPGSLLTYGSATPSTPNVTPYQGPIGTIVQSPSGTSSTTVGMSNVAYSNNSLKRTGVCAWTLDQGNLSGGGIGAFQLSTAGSLGMFQFGMSPKVNKDATKLLNITFEYSWSRHA